MSDQPTQQTCRECRHFVPARHPSGRRRYDVMGTCDVPMPPLTKLQAWRLYLLGVQNGELQRAMADDARLCLFWEPV